MTGALAARGSTEGFTLDWRHEQAVASSYRRQVGTTLSEANVCLWHKADMLNALTNVRFWEQTGHLTNRYLISRRQAASSHLVGGVLVFGLF
jgi:hypothetical protein